MGENEQLIIKAIKKNSVNIKTAHHHKGDYFNFVFLCGGEKKENDNRSTIQKIIETNKKNKTLYSEDLLHFLDDFDLLTFEELLLELSSTVVIIVESFGSACELGAFSFVDKSLDKLLIINDKKHKGKKSFINEGPLKKIKENSNGQVFFEKFLKQPEGYYKLVVSRELSNKLDSLKEHKSFKKVAYDTKTLENTLIINDVSFLLWLLIDIIKVFGSVKKNTFYDLLINIFEVQSIVIKHDTNNQICKKEDVINVINFIIKVITNFNFLTINKGHYVINYKYLSTIDVNVNEFSSLLFKNDFMNARESLFMRAKIINKQKKKGVVIWDS